MAGHSHWAGIKHKKEELIKKDQKYFQNFQEKLLLLLKIGDKNPDMNPRLRTAIQAAKTS